MLSRFAKLLLVATSFAPVLMAYALASFLRTGSLRIPLALFVAAGLSVWVCLWLVRTAARSLERLPFSVQALRTADAEVVGFLLAYLLPLVNSSDDVINPLILAFILAVVLAAVWTTHSYHFNPVLGLLGYHFYEVDAADGITYLLMTRRDLRNTKALDRVVQLTEYMVLDPHGTTRNS